jgi:DNA-binding MarR family transcriptional regulator
MSTTDVADLLHSAAIHLLRRAGEEDATAGITRARLSALSVVVFRGPLTLTALAQAEGVRPATMTRIVAALEEAGLVRREPNAADGRSVLISRTDDGGRVLAGARGRRIDAIAARLGDVSEDDLSVLRRAGELLEERFALRPRRSAAHFEAPASGTPEA